MASNRATGAYLLVLFRPWVMEGTNLVDRYLHGSPAPGKEDLLYEEDGGVRYLCFEDEFVYESQASGCYWDAEDFFGLLAAYDETTPKEEMLSIAREVRADVSALNSRS